MSKGPKDGLVRYRRYYFFPVVASTTAEASKLAAEDKEGRPVYLLILRVTSSQWFDVRERQVAGDRSRLLARKDRALSRNDALPLDAALISPLASANFKTRTPFRRNCQTLPAWSSSLATRFHRRHWIEQSGRAVHRNCPVLVLGVGLPASAVDPAEQTEPAVNQPLVVEKAFKPRRCLPAGSRSALRPGRSERPPC